MPELEWHEMADEQPTDEDAHYLLIKNYAKRYAPASMYIGSISKSIINGSIEVLVIYGKQTWMRLEDFKAWAKIPEYEMTPKQAAEHLGISASRVRAMLRTKTLNGFKEPNGNEWRIRATEIDRYKRGEDTQIQGAAVR